MLRDSIPARALRRLSELTVADVMSRDVVTISAGDGMGLVARAFRRKEISSAPVVDKEGRCIGILSASDFVKREYALEQPATRGSLANTNAVRERATSPGGAKGLADAEDLASTYMTSAVQSIDPHRSLLAAARMMSASHIHRLVVLDAEERPVGMVSTMDIMAALLNAIDEAESAIG